MKTCGKICNSEKFLGKVIAGLKKVYNFASVE